VKGGRGGERTEKQKRSIAKAEGPTSRGQGMNVGRRCDRTTGGACSKGRAGREGPKCDGGDGRKWREWDYLTGRTGEVLTKTGG